MELAIELQIDTAIHIRNLNACAHQRLLGCEIETEPCFTLKIPTSSQPQGANRWHEIVIAKKRNGHVKLSTVDIVVVVGFRVAHRTNELRLHVAKIKLDAE